MNPSVARALKIATAVLTFVAGAGPLVADLNGTLPPTWLAVASKAVGIAGALVLFLSQSPLPTPILQSAPPSSKKAS
jgi:hypothetical protein